MSRSRWKRSWRVIGGEAGAAVPEFLMVSILLIFLTLLILQAALYLYVRNVVTASAAEGARYAANANVDPRQGAARASSVLARGTNRSAADRLRCEGSEEPGAGGATLDVVRCSGSIPALFLPGFGVIPLDVRGRAIEEEPR
ncbi:MAG: TadE/TadG family type IV pilus assembly protein [Terriglobales bacterium]